MIRHFSCACALLLFSTALVFAQAAESSTFYVVRHADRDGKNDALTADGVRRAEALAEMMKRLKVSAVYSTDTERTRNTAAPTAKAVGAKVGLYAGLKASWFEELKKKHTGQSVLIVGHSNTVGPIVNAFGDTLEIEMTEDEYDRLFVVSCKGSSTRAVEIPFGPAGESRDLSDESTWKHGVAQSGDVKIHYVTVGKGPLLIMIHGFPDFWYSWRKQIPELAKRFQVVAIDQRGYNKSDQPDGVENYTLALLSQDVQNVIKHFEQKKAVLVAHDWGAYVAWTCAMRYPQSVERLVILNGPHPGGLSRELANNQEQQKNSQYARNFQKADAASRLTAKGLAGWVTDKKAVPKYIAAFERSSFEGMLNYYKANYPKTSNPKTSDSEPKKEPAPVAVQTYPKIKCPVLMIHGLDDKALMPAALNDSWTWMEKELTLVTIPGAGHFVQQDAADSVTRQISGWLKMTDASGAVENSR